MKRKKPNENKVKILFGIILFLVCLVGVLALIQLNVFNFLTGFFTYVEPEFFVINDECSLVLGNLLHKIKTDGECKIMCSNNCDFNDKEFYNSSFSISHNSCNTCNCYCK